jgi:hypothetical protein
MAHFIPVDNQMQHGIVTPLSLTDLQTYVNGFVKFINLQGGDCMAVHEDSDEFGEVNQTATMLSGRTICGHAVLFHSGELE